MKKSIIRGCYTVVMFVAALFLMSHFMNKGNTDITMEMSDATFPLVYVLQQDRQINEMHGYTDKMDTAFQNETITVMDAADRKLAFRIKTFGNTITALAFEVRNVSGERLIEDTAITDFTQSEDTAYAQITLKDLLEKDKEYSLCLHLSDNSGRSLYYYTRVIVSESASCLQEEIDFALDFSSRTFDKERAQEITKYLESNADGDNTTYSRVTIHSSFSQITWGTLNVKKETEPQVFVRRSNPYLAGIELRYIVSLSTGMDTEYHNVTEYYLIRYGKERMYLLDYERTMNSIFSHANNIFTNNKISLGITDENISMTESEDGNIFAFVKEGRLYSMNLTDNKLALLFGFYDTQHADERTLYQNADIRVISVDETGNIRFLVYGYMNRGNHEGSVGVCCYYYNSMLNTIEEEIYIPYSGSTGLLAQDVSRLAYVNNQNQLFMLLYGSIYQIDLTTKSYDVLVEGLSAGNYCVSASGRMIAWQEGEDSNACRVLRLMNLNSGHDTRIEAGSARYIKPLGFMNEDLIYGMAYGSDISRDSLGMTIFPMYQVCIQDERGNLLKKYEKSGIYVTQAQIEGNQIKLTRVRSAGTSGEYEQTTDDQIMNDVAVSTDKNQVEVVVTQDYEKIVQIAAKTNFKVSSLKYLTPKQVMYEGERSLMIKRKTEDNPYYYVYDKYGICGVLAKESEAIRLADQCMGYVQNAKGQYIWEKSSRKAVNQIMWFSEETMTNDAMPEGRTSLAVCLDNMMQFEGVSRNSQNMLDMGKSLMTILRDNLGEKQILDLSGCTLGSVLYYVGKEAPVLALLHDGNAVLIVGYNELNTVIYNPVSKTVSKMGMNDSKEYFEANGNWFITYIDREDE